MAVGFSFEEAKQPLEPQGFSFDEAKTPAPKVEEAPVAPATPEEVAPVAEAPSLVPPEEVTATQPSSVVPEDEGFFARNYRYAKDALLSGFENIRANTKGEALAIARGSMLSYEKQYGGPGIPLAPPDVKKKYEKYKAEAGEYAQDIAKFQKEAKERELASPLRPETARPKAAMGDDVAFLESAKEAGAALISNPVGVIADLGAESFPAMAYMVSTALVGRLGLQSSTAGAVGGGVGSAVSQFGNEYVNRLQKGESHDEAWKNAEIRSGVIGVFDAISLKTAGSAAGKIVEALRTNKPATVAAKEFTKEMGKQAGLGAAGEAVGSLAIGEIPNPAAVIAEAAGELVTGPFEAVGAYQKVKQTAQDQAIADIERQLNKAAEEREKQQEILRNVFATGFKQQTGRDATEEEIEGMVEAYEQRKLAERATGPDAAGRIEPSLQVPDQTGVGAGITEQPTETGAGGVEVSGVPTGGVGVGATAKSSPLAEQFQPREGLSPQENRNNIHYNALMTDPANPVTQSLNALDASIQKAKDAYANIAARLNIPSGKDMIGLSARLPAPIGALLNYPSTAGAAVRLVSASKDLTAGNKRGSQAKVDSALKQVQGDINKVDQIIANALAAAEDPTVQAGVDKLNEQLAVSNAIAARQAEIAALPMEQRSAKMQQIENEVLAGLKGEQEAKVPTGFAYIITESPAYDGIDPLSADDAVGELEFLLEQAKRNRLTPENFLQSEIGKRLDTGQISAINKSLKSNPVGTIQSLINALQAPPTTKDNALDAEIKAVDSVYYDPNTVNGIPTDQKSAEVQHMDRTAKEALQALADDFLVGDEVRVGNIPGVVVGVEPTHIRFRPLRAEDPKAYIKVRKAQVKLENRPNTTDVKPVSSARELKFAERQGRLDADMDNLLANLGQSMYGSGITDVAVKELLQNSFDAIKEAIYHKVMTGIGHISITLNEVDRTITIEDDGIGMTSDIVDGAFFKIAGTAKDVPPQLSSGGYGFAKVAFMTSTESISLDTAREGVRNTVSATASQIRRSDFKIKTAPAPKKEHGTKVVVKIPKSYVDQKGEEQSIWFKTSPTSIQALTKPLVGPVEVKVTSITSYANPETTILQTGVNFDYGAMPLLTKVNFDWGTADIYYAVNRSENPKHYVLSSGVYQFNGTGGSYGKFMLTQQDPIPFDIIVDIKSNVKPQNTQYPFTTSRETFRPSHEADVKALVAYLQQVARGAEAQGLQDSFKNIVSMPRIDVGADIRETSEKLKKVFDKRRDEVSKFELPPMPEEVTVRGTQVFDLKGTVLADGRPEDERKIKGSFEAEKEAPKMEQFLLQMSQNPSQPIFHNNTNVDFLEVGRAYGNPEQFFAELGSLYVEMKEAIAKSGMYGYDVLDPKNLWFTGISIDKKYGGLSLLVPYKANYLNPFYDWGARSLFGVRENFLNTMIHELAHVRNREHGVGHNQQMLQIQQYLGDSGIMDYYRDALLDILVRHESTFTAMREAYGRSTTKNTAKSLEDYEESTASAPTGSPISGSEYAPPALQAGERSRGGSDIRPTGATDPTSPIRAGSDEELIVNLGMQSGKFSRPVLEALAKDNLTGALQALAARTTGFYGDLAKVLADLKLPTTIVLNNPANLIRRQINELVAPQQFRLFDYVQRTYPDVYKKYFENYDRAENLEKVYEGLKFLKERNFNMGPVIAEFEDVTGAFNKNIKGLVVPGFFAPEFDTIYLNLESASNDVLLHEVLHAATEAVINADLDTLTPGQRAALEQLYEMFEYAKKQIPLDLYGFTDLHEFVSELFTNKAFRERIQKIPYAPAKQSLLTSIARTIYRLFGINNLAGNAMAQATQLFSAVRTKKPISIGIRFASAPRKAQVRGPITNNWRADEDYGKSYLDMYRQMVKGGVPWPNAAKKVAKLLFDARHSQLRRMVLPEMGLRHLSDVTKMAFPQLQAAVRIVEQMLSYRNQLMTKAASIADDWMALQKKGPTMERLMCRIMLEATLRRIDPDTASSTELDPNDALARAWDVLPDAFRNVYRRVRDFYSNNLNETIREMKSRIMKSGKSLSEKKELLRQLNRQFSLDKLVKPYFPIRRFGRFWFQVGKGNFKEFVEFEDEGSRNIAMELRRQQLIAKGRSDLANTMLSGNGLSELYSKNIATTKVLADVQSLVDELGAIPNPTPKQYKEIEAKLTKELGRKPTVAEVEQRFSTAQMKEELKSSIDQLIYVLLPQQSMRKMFINRQGIQGASADMLRVFATTAVHSAYQQSRFKYAEQFLANLNTARDYVHDKYKGSPNAAVYGDFILEVEARTKQIMSNEDYNAGAVISSKIAEGTYLYMLTAPATALVNLLGFPQLVMSNLGGAYGFVKAYRIAARHFRGYGKSSVKRSFLPLLSLKPAQARFPSLFESGQLNALQQKAADVFLSENDVNISLTSDIMGLGDTPSALYTGRYARAKNFISQPLHQTERIMREVGLLTAFELAYEKFLKEPKRDLSGYVLRDASGQPLMRTQDEAFDDAIQEARDRIGLSLGDFTRQMKPRIMAIPGVNVLFIFKAFPIYATIFIGRTMQEMYSALSASEKQDIRRILSEDLKNAVNSQQIIDQRITEINENLKTIRKEAFSRMAGLLGTAALLGGVAATPFFSIVGTIIAAWFGPDDDEFFDWENWFRNYCQRVLGGYASDLLQKMGASEKTAEEYGKKMGLSVARGPVATATGISLSDRVSLDLRNLWWRDPRYAREERQAALEAAISIGGPAAGLAMNFVDAYSLFNDGRLDRATEKAVPNVVSSPMKAYRMSQEGAKTLAGDELIKEFSAWELALQSIGFQPERLAVKQKSVIEGQTYSKKIEGRKTAIMDRLWYEYENGDSKSYEKALEARDKFNDTYPDFRITPKELNESFEKRRKARNQAEDFGARVTKKLRGRVDPMLDYGRE